jgi:hypothetical protein
MSQPLVSVIIPTYNRADAAFRAVQSALDQDYDPLEVIVVDDGSRDDTLERLAAFGDRVRIVRHPENCGAAAARNTGIEAALGEYVALLDSDDLWVREKTTLQLEFMLRHGLAMSCTGFRSIYGAGEPAVRKIRPYGSRLSIEDLVWGIYVAPGSTLIARRSLLLELGGYDVSLPRLEDWDLLLRAVTQTGELGFLDDDLAILHPSAGVSAATLLTSAEMLVERGMRALAGQGPGIVRKFRAGVSFEVAAALWKCGSRARSLTWLIRSVLLVPFGHVSLRIILYPWLQHQCMGLRRLV